MTSEVIELRQICKSYFSSSEETNVLFKMDLVVRSGDFVAIMGKSGSGKSTLMNILGCLDKPTAGHYFLGGVDTHGLSQIEMAKIRSQKIGFVFQSFNLIKRMNISENVALPLIYAGVPRSEAFSRAIAELERVGIAEYAKRLPSQLSGGQQQRVAIARALIGGPAIILADEPTGNLDTQTSLEIMAMLKNLNDDRGITIILVTHEPNIARGSERLIRIKDGRIEYDGSTIQGLPPSEHS
jgi:putative ABC transport system ATP-binding protein